MAQPQLNIDLSTQYGALTGALQGHCYTNSMCCLLLMYPRVHTYVEGWMVAHDSQAIFVVEHGWCQNDLHLIDPTLSFFQTTQLFYFPGIIYTLEEVLTIASRDRWLPRVRWSNYGADGLKHPAYASAQQQAMEKAQEFASTHPSKKIVQVQVSVPSDAPQPGSDLP